MESTKELRDVSKQLPTPTDPSTLFIRLQQCKTVLLYAIIRKILSPVYSTVTCRLQTYRLLTTNDCSSNSLFSPQEVSVFALFPYWHSHHCVVSLKFQIQTSNWPCFLVKVLEDITSWEVWSKVKTSLKSHSFPDFHLSISSLLKWLQRRPAAILQCLDSVYGKSPLISVRILCMTPSSLEFVISTAPVITATNFKSVQVTSLQLFPKLSLSHQSV